MGARFLVVVLAMAGWVASLSSQAAKPSVDELMARVGAYVASYGEKASLIVAVEKYTQSSVLNYGAERPRQLIAEFAIVRTPAGWVGYRDVVEVNGQKISDRRDRLMSIFTDPAADSRMVQKLSEESARFNIGPITRNFNLPTTVMLLFQPVNLPRFVFTLKEQELIDGTQTQEVAFKEVRTPTMSMTRAGRDVPMEGSLWVVPTDGAVVRTRMRMRNFADAATTDATGGVGKIDSSVDFNVTYSWHAEFGLWLPREMTEQYAGPVQGDNGRGYIGRSRTNATYSEFKSFQTGVTFK